MSHNIYFLLFFVTGIQDVPLEFNIYPFLQDLRVGTSGWAANLENFLLLYLEASFDSLLLVYAAVVELSDDGDDVVSVAFTIIVKVIQL